MKKIGIEQMTNGVKKDKFLFTHEKTLFKKEDG